MSAAEAAATLVCQYYEAVDNNDVDALVDLFSDNATYRRPGYPLIEGKEALTTFYRSTRIIESGQHTLTTVLVDADRVAVTGEFHGRARDGRDLEVRFADFFTVTDRKLVARETFFDAPAV